MKHGDCYEGSQAGCEEEGMTESAVAPEVAVANAEVEADDIQVWQDRAERSGEPDAFGRAGAMEAGAEAERGDGVGEGGWQIVNLQP